MTYKSSYPEEPSETPLVSPARYPTAHETAGEVLAIVLDETEFPRTERLTALRERVAIFTDPASAEALDMLRSQLATLDALYQRLSADAVQARSPAHRALLLKAALNAQQAFSRTFALLHALAREAHNADAIEMDGAG